MLDAPAHCAFRIVLAIALILALPRVARAADDAPSDEAALESRRSEARTHYEGGVKAYERGRYKDAIDLFLAADRLAPSASLSFNIAHAYEKLGDDAGALRWFRDYLRRNPNAPNAAEVRDKVGRLALVLAKKGVQQVTVLSQPSAATISIDDQPVGVSPWTGELTPGHHRLLVTLRDYSDVEQDLELSASQPLDVSVRLERRLATAPAAASPAAAPAAAAPAAAPEAPPSPPPPAPATDSAGPKFGVWPWVTLGAGAAALGGALTFELLRRSSEDDAEHEPTQLGFQDAVSTMESRKTAARVLLGVGGALVVGGVVLVVLDRSGGSATSVGLSCGPGTCLLSAGGRL